jgi:hypothetical protein
MLNRGLRGILGAVSLASCGVACAANAQPLAFVPTPRAAHPAQPVPLKITPARPARDYFGWMESRSRARYARNMADVVPVRGAGLHLSGGTRFVPGYVADRTSPDAAVAMTFDLRRLHGPIGLRDGFEHHAAVALVGFSRPIGRWRAGVDVGAMNGRAIAVYPFVDRSSGVRDARSGFNPVAAVTLDLAF